MILAACVTDATATLFRVFFISAPMVGSKLISQISPCFIEIFKINIGKGGKLLVVFIIDIKSFGCFFHLIVLFLFFLYYHNMQVCLQIKSFQSIILATNNLYSPVRLNFPHHRLSLTSGRFYPKRREIPPPKTQTPHFSREIIRQKTQARHFPREIPSTKTQASNFPREIAS